jgi:rhodanese-related sulfurtransferase
MHPSAVPRIAKEDLHQRLNGSGGPVPIVVDVRLKYPYEHSTLKLPGAIRMAPGALDASAFPSDREIVLYDSDPEELVSEQVAAELIRLGYRAAVLRGGLAEWVNAKLPTETKPAPHGSVPAPGALKG